MLEGCRGSEAPPWSLARFLEGSSESGAWGACGYAAAKRARARDGVGFCDFVVGLVAVAKWWKLSGRSARPQVSKRKRRIRSPVLGSVLGAVPVWRGHRGQGGAGLAGAQRGRPQQGIGGHDGGW